MNQSENVSEIAQPDNQQDPVSRRLFMGLAATTAAVVAGSGGLVLRHVLADEATPAASPMASHAAHAASPETAAPATGTPTPFDGITGQPLIEPDVRESVAGLLDTQLEAKLGPLDVAGRQVMSAVYEGSMPGPTLALHPGDTFKLTLVNNLDDCTNMHTHGFHVSPKDNSDNIFLKIDPGTAFEYEYKIPDDHPSGLYWYHPHCHGNTSFQVTSGMAGALVVKGGLDHFEGIAGLTDRLLVVQTTQFDGDGTMVPLDQQSTNTRMRFVNGQLQPTIAIQPGETQRWRVANVSSDDFLLLSLTGHRLHVIANDGMPFNRVETVDEILMGPAERVEFLVQASTTPGSYEFRSLAWGDDYQTQPDVLLATMIANGDVLEPSPLPADLIPFEDLSLLEIDNQRVTVFEEPGPPLFLAIDGKHWDPDRIDQTVKLGALEEWIVRNTSSHRHPFHIHVNDFQVVALNGEPVQARGWQDTVTLPPNTDVTIRMRFTDFDGKFVYHCHILSHEDFGMMANVEVVP
jgi:suppressor of ftsI